MLVFSRLELPVPEEKAKNKPTTEKLGRIEWDQTVTGFAHSSFVSLCYLVVVFEVFFKGTVGGADAVEGHWSTASRFST